MNPRRGARKKKSLSRRGRSHKTTFATAGEEANSGKKKKAPPRPPTGRRLWLFRILSVTVVPVLVLLLAELSLRIIGYGFNADAIVKCRVGGEDAYCDNGRFTWRFFPRNIARQFEPFVFPADKPADTYRIFVLGASAARGEPDPAFNFTRILRLLLQDQYPQMNFELINTAIVAINSHVVLEIAKDCARYDPDLFIVYLGNNEVTGPYGAGTVYTRQSVNLQLVRLSIALKATRLGQLIAGLFEAVGDAKSTPKIWRGLEMFLDDQVRAESPKLQAVYRNYEKNLRDISRVARKSEADIIFCSVGANLKDCPPFASLHRSDLTHAERKEWQEIYEQGNKLESAGDCSGAIERYLAAAEIDDTHADLQFRLGRCYWTGGQYDKARRRYVKARELDTLRFRADNRINAVVRKVAGSKADEGIYLVDAAGFLEDNSPHNTTGEELFYEHVHLNFKGTYLLAGAIFERLRTILAQKAGPRPGLSQAECAKRLAYTGWDRHESAVKILDGFIRKPPFTNQLYHQNFVEEMVRKIESLKIHMTPEALEKAAAEYRRVIEKTPGDWVLHWKYGKLLAEDLKDYRNAAEQYHLVQQLVPHSHLGHTAMGQVYRGLGELDGAVAQYQQAIRIKPTCIEAHYYLGWAYMRQNKMDLAKEYFSKTIRLQPDYMPAYNDLAEILYRQGRIDEAIETCRRGLVFSPNSSLLHGNLGMLLNMKGHRQEAIEELRIALNLDPDSARIRKMLEAVLSARN
jgi:tetratricopeptide (TPR) repeat protein